MLRILQEISERVRPHAAEIANDAWIIGHLDLIRAKVRFIQERQAVVPQLSENQEIQLLHVCHPLVKNAVANDVYFGQDLTAIVITGPNTGGKTIMLKTLGLTQVMAQSGLPILADKGSRVGIFEEIFADIGDEQSIEQSLSTFSSHMTNIVDILGKVNQHSLLLLDELGAGTDPQEEQPLPWLFWRTFACVKSRPWRRPTIQNSRPTVLRQPLCKMPVWSLILQLFARPIALCRVFLAEVMPLKLPNV